MFLLPIGPQALSLFQTTSGFASSVLPHLSVQNADLGWTPLLVSVSVAVSIAFGPVWLIYDLMVSLVFLVSISRTVAPCSFSIIGLMIFFELAPFLGARGRFARGMIFTCQFVRPIV